MGTERSELESEREGGAALGREGAADERREGPGVRTERSELESEREGGAALGRAGAADERRGGDRGWGPSAAS